jgi:porin
MARSVGRAETGNMFNNDEPTQFLNDANDGNLGIASDGTYAGGSAIELFRNG